MGLDKVTEEESEDWRRTNDIARKHIRSQEWFLDFQSGKISEHGRYPYLSE